MILRKIVKMPKLLLPVFRATLSKGVLGVVFWTCKYCVVPYFKKCPCPLRRSPKSIVESKDLEFILLGLFGLSRGLLHYRVLI